MHPTRHRFTIPPKIQGRIAGGDLRLLVSSGLPVLEDAAPFSPISNPKIVGQFLLLCGSPRVMQLGLNVETGEVGPSGPGRRRASRTPRSACTPIPLPSSPRGCPMTPTRRGTPITYWPRPTGSAVGLRGSTLPPSVTTPSGTRSPGTWSMANGPRKIEGSPPGHSRARRPAFSAAACVPLLMRAALPPLRGRDAARLRILTHAGRPRVCNPTPRRSSEPTPPRPGWAPLHPKGRR